jgi:hypothetical protein
MKPRTATQENEQIDAKNSSIRKRGSGVSDLEIRVGLATGRLIPRGRGSTTACRDQSGGKPAVSDRVIGLG